MLRRALRNLAFALALAGVSTAAQAQLAADQVARLGKDLTPMGAEKAGNKEGGGGNLSVGCRRRATQWPAFAAGRIQQSFTTGC